ncbi:MAG: hypothetical protein IT195_08070 [Microthrixaceae bacterium]|nr:hypothetical protein [Microthrixaceae bacterium]
MSAGLEEISRRVGALVAAEVASFEAVGSRVVDAPPDLAGLFAGISCHHAWRAHQLREHLFPLGGYQVDDFVVLSGDFAAILGTLEGAETPMEAAAVVRDELLVALSAMIGDTRAVCGLVADAPLLRTLDLVEFDLLRDKANATPQQPAP